MERREGGVERREGGMEGGEGGREGGRRGEDQLNGEQVRNNNNWDTVLTAGKY